METSTPGFPPPMYRLVNRQLMKDLMERTGDGSRIGHRPLAKAAGCSHGTIGFLLDGTQETVPVDIAHGIAQRLGVGVLVLFAPPHCAEPAGDLHSISAVSA